MSSSKIHVAIIMDGNGRWAKSSNKTRSYGHKKGTETLKKLVKDISKSNLPIKFLSVFAFSLENWNRSKMEVNYLLKLFEQSLSDKLINNLNDLNIKFLWTGFKTKLSKSLINKINNIVKKTAKNSGLILNLVFNYGGRQEILNMKKSSKNLLTKNIPDVDLLIRTGGEKRISNFFLYQIAYAEIIFEKKYWPDYSINTLKNNIIEYESRDRRFGKETNEN